MERPSAWDIAHSLAMAIACLLSYTVMTKLLNAAIEGHDDLLGGMWAAVD
jgi:hypothetical protein